MTLFERDQGPARVRLVVAYDGTGVPRFAAQPDVAHGRGVLGRGARAGAAPRGGDLTSAGRTDAGVHAWGQVVTFDADPGVDPWRLAASLNGMLGTGDRRARGRARRARLRRPPLGAVARVPLHDRQPPVARPVPRPVRVVGADAARPRRAAPRRGPVRRRARLRLVLPPRTGRHDDHAAGLRVRAGTISATACSATTSAPTRSAGRWCARSSARSSTSASASGGPATSWRSCAPRTAPTPAGSPRPTACASGRSGTDGCRRGGSVFGMAKRGSTAESELAKYREMWADELGGAALYRALAEHADEQRQSIFLSLAEAEERHAAHWANLMRQAGVTDLEAAAVAVPDPGAAPVGEAARHRVGAADRPAGRGGRCRQVSERRALRRRRWRPRRPCTARSSPPCAAATRPAAASPRRRGATGPGSAARSAPASSA